MNERAARWMESHGPVVGWVIGTLIAVGVAYGTLSGADAKVATAVAAIERQFDRHEQLQMEQYRQINEKLNSIEEYLRRQDVAGRDRPRD